MSSQGGRMIRVVAVLVAVAVVACVAHRSDYEDLREAFTWKQLDFQYPTPEDRKMAVDSGEFLQANNIPIGIEVWRDKIFMTLPRYKRGVPASLVYFKMTDRRDSPLLKPYPDWKSHNLSHLTEGRIVSPFRMKADSCNRLWVLDTGTNDFMGNREQLSLPQVMVYNLLTDQLIRNYTLPQDQSPDKSFFANIAVDVVDCNATWAYLGDLGAHGLVVYDWAQNKSWRISHESFKFNPSATNFSINGLSFQFMDGLFGMALSKLHSATKNRALYYHPLASYNEYKVSTKYLKNESLTLGGANADKFVDMGSRGPNTQSSSSVVDENTGILLYTLPNFNSIGCWDSRKSFSPSHLGSFGANSVKMIYPNDLKVSPSGRLWVVTNKMPIWRFSGLNATDVNFRLMTGSVAKLTALSRCAVSGGGRRSHVSLPLIIPVPLPVGGTGGFGGFGKLGKKFKGRG